MHAVLLYLIKSEILDCFIQNKLTVVMQGRAGAAGQPGPPVSIPQLRIMHEFVLKNYNGLRNNYWEEIRSKIPQNGLKLC